MLGNFVSKLPKWFWCWTSLKVHQSSTDVTMWPQITFKQFRKIKQKVDVGHILVVGMLLCEWFCNNFDFTQRAPILLMICLLFYMLCRLHHSSKSSGVCMLKGIGSFLLDPPDKMLPGEERSLRFPTSLHSYMSLQDSICWYGQLLILVEGGKGRRW
jgi:hypothetical protein